MALYLVQHHARKREDWGVYGGDAGDMGSMGGTGNVGGMSLGMASTGSGENGIGLLVALAALSAAILLG